MNNFFSRRDARRILCLLVFAMTPALALAAPVEFAPGVQVDRERGEIRLEAVVQKSEGRAAHTKWGEKSTGFIGARGGMVDEDFVFIFDADRSDVDRAAREGLGWQGGRTFSWGQSLLRRGFSKRTDLDDFMTGDPVLVGLEFEKAGRKVLMPLQDAIRARVEVDKKWVERPYTPHFVYTGAGEINDINSGCLTCPSDCVGALITDNRMPVQTEFEEYLVDWSKLPEPGTAVTVVLRGLR